MRIPYTQYFYSRETIVDLIVVVLCIFHRVLEEAGAIFSQFEAQGGEKGERHDAVQYATSFVHQVRPDGLWLSVCLLVYACWSVSWSMLAGLLVYACWSVCLSMLDGLSVGLCSAVCLLVCFLSLLVNVCWSMSADLCLLVYVCWSMSISLCLLVKVCWSMYAGLCMLVYVWWSMSGGLCILVYVCWSMPAGKCLLIYVCSYGLCLLV